MTLTIVPGGIRGYKLPDEFDHGFESIASAGKSGDTKLAVELLWQFAPMLTAAKKPDVRSKIDQMLADYSWIHFRAEDSPIPLTPPPADQITRLQPPLLLVQGEDEVYYFRELGKWMQLHVSGSERFEIPEGGPYC